jgi:hypothetical protein
MTAEAFQEPRESLRSDAAYISLFVYPSCNPDLISESLGLVPTESHRKGGIIISPGGRRRVVARNIWCLRSYPNVDSVELCDHISWMCEQVLPVRDKLRELSLSGTLVRLVAAKWDTNVVEIGPIALATVAELGLGLTLSVLDYRDD